FGGRGPENHALSDTLAFDGSACMDITPATAPEPRERGALAFDSQRGQIVMFGGWDGSGGAESLSAALTWRFDEEGWLGAALPGSPPRVTGHSMAYDPLRDRVVLFGGGTEPPPSSPDPGQVVMSARTFEYDGAAWAEVFPSHAPQARSNHRLVFDTSLGKVLLFGGVQGMDPQSGAFGDTWIFDGADWTELNPIHSPPARSWFMLAHDETRQETLVHGGISDEVTALTDTWVFDGTDWVERHPVNAPSWRAAAAVGFDPLRKRVVLYGGLFLSGYLDDVWEWDGIDWTRAYSLPPPARGMVEMVYHRGLRQMVLFGGYNGQPFGDTWFYRYASQWPDEDCKNGVDDDGDGDVDCADPDCEGQGCPGGGSCAGGVCVTP
ncbi:MAG: hypothetical protein RBU30_11585, partial [Polyangia bacterium]|nr:hypothetical protein [Polyangia bacterium]